MYLCLRDIPASVRVRFPTSACPLLTVQIRVELEQLDAESDEGPLGPFVAFTRFSSTRRALPLSRPADATERQAQPVVVAAPETPKSQRREAPG